MKWVIIPTTLIEVYLHNIYDIYTTKKLFCCGADKFQYLWCIQRFCPARLNYLLGRIWSHISTTSKENTFFCISKRTHNPDPIFLHKAIALWRKIAVKRKNMFAWLSLVWKCVLPIPKSVKVLHENSCIQLNL